jgi:uncharacterized Zn finger protein (UPF0148 family)
MGYYWYRKTGCFVGGLGIYYSMLGAKMIDCECTRCGWSKSAVCKGNVRVCADCGEIWPDDIDRKKLIRAATEYLNGGLDNGKSGTTSTQEKTSAE